MALRRHGPGGKVPPRAADAATDAEGPGPERVRIKTLERPTFEALRHLTRMRLQDLGNPGLLFRIMISGNGSHGHRLRCEGALQIRPTRVSRKGVSEQTSLGTTKSCCVNSEVMHGISPLKAFEACGGHVCELSFRWFWGVLTFTLTTTVSLTNANLRTATATSMQVRVRATAMAW